MADKAKIKKIDDIFKDAALSKKFEEYCKKMHGEENYSFYALKSWRSENVYKLYFAEGAKLELNLPAPQLKLARELGTKKFWDDSRWDKVMADAKKEIGRVLQDNYFAKFMQTV